MESTADDRTVDTGAPFLFIASMDVTPEKEALFNEVYDEEHVRHLSAVPGVLSVARYESARLIVSIGGRLQEAELNRPKYHTFFALNSPQVLVSDAWSAAIEAGRWPDQVRPFTFNRQHQLCQRHGL
jgi:hypothetical protein